MKLLLISICLLFTPPVKWMGNFDDALKQAAGSHKQILINFSGSDWCGPCIRLSIEILSTAAFENYANAHLVLVRADFPRQKKNRLTAEQTRLNEALADRYNPDGKFPFTVLTDENGKVIRSWEGFPPLSPEQFVQEIEKAGTRR